MHKNIIKNITKITILTFIFILLFNLWNQALNAWWWKSDKKENIDNFTSMDISWLNEVWVALSINIWTKFYTAGNINDSWLYNDIIPISMILTNRDKTNEILITKNIESIKDYINISKIDIKWYLDSWERQDTYNSLVNQLKIRYKTWYANSKNLEIQINNLITAIKEVENAIENTKQSMSTNMKVYNAKWLNNNINDYLILKNQYNTYRTYIIYCNQFLKYYNGLNNYNRNILTNLKLNQTAIINKNYVVIPDSWSEMLKNLNLIYDESSLPENLKSFSWLDTTTNTINYNNWYSNNSIDWEWLLWDPFNLKNKDSDTLKQSWWIDFWMDKLITN